jgi:hypothetical protein
MDDEQPRTFNNDVTPDDAILPRPTGACQPAVDAVAVVNAIGSLYAADVPIDQVAVILADLLGAALALPPSSAFPDRPDLVAQRLRNRANALRADPAANPWLTIGARVNNLKWDALKSAVPKNRPRA